MKTKTKATTTKPTKLELKIKKLNAAYKKASPAQRRVMIAKDALAQIERGKIRPESGTYVYLRNGHTIGYDTPLQPALLKDSPITCDCCAKGALFISCVRLSNRYNGNPSGIGSGGINSLVNWPAGNYEDIEAAFELWHGDAGYDTGGYSTSYSWVRKWEEKYPEGGHEEDRDRLVAILKNIIRNRGLFNKNKV